MHLLRAFGEQASGFYIDIGAGHPVYDNVSFAFYLRGWRGITVEPNPWLAQLSEAVRPRDVRIQSLVGAAAGRSDLLSGRGFSRPLDHGRRPRPRGAERIRQALAGDDRCRSRRLRALCEQHAPDAIDFLKIDVEGAEREVLLGGDWRRFRPKVVVAEALAPVTHGAGLGGLGAAAHGAAAIASPFSTASTATTSPRSTRRWRERLAAAPALVRRRDTIPPVQAGARRRLAPRPRPRPAAWPAPTWCGCR